MAVNGKVKLSDVAARAKVSTATASQVLSPRKGSIRVAEKTALLVRRVAAELNYRPDLSAQMLAGKRSNLVGALIDSYAPGCHQRILAAFESHLAGSGMRLIVGQAHDNENNFRQCIADFIAHRTEAIILLAHRYPNKSVDFYDCFGDYRNLVFFGKPDCPGGFNYIEVDLAAGMRSVVAHLARTGRRKIAAVFAIPTLDTKAFFRQAVEASGLNYYPEFLLTLGHYELRDHYEPDETELRDIAGILKRNQVDAVISFDHLAMRLLPALKQAGLRIPEDIAVAGCDNEPVDKWLDPPLTSIDLVHDRVAGELFRLTQAMAHGLDAPAEIILQPEVIFRRSTE